MGARPYDVTELARTCPSGKVHTVIALKPVPPRLPSGEPNEHSGLDTDGTIKDGYLEQAVGVALAKAATCGYRAYVSITDPSTNEKFDVLNVTFDIDRSRNEDLQARVENVVTQAIERAETRWYRAHRPLTSDELV